MSATMRNLTAVLVSVLAGSAASRAAEPITVDFVDHLEAGLQEIDVFVARQPGPDVYRVNPDTKDVADMTAMVYATAEPVAHDPFDFTQDGPFPKGKPLNFTLEDWLAAKGSATIGCEDGKGSVKASFASLVPNGVYTMWFALVPTPPTEPFTGTLDLPVGPRDGSGSAFTADDAGNATFQAGFDGCLEASAANFMSILAIAWHSDGKTYGSSPGPFGEVTHVQLFAPLPKSTDGQS